MRQRQHLERSLNDFRRLERDFEDNVTLIELGEAEEDEATVSEGESALKRLDEEVQRKSIEAMLSGEADDMDTYVEIHAGAGGTESQDWAQMLTRMYMRWAERRGFKVKLIDVIKDFLEICASVKQDNEALSPSLQEDDQKVVISYEEMLDVRLYGFVTQRTQDKLEQARLQSQGAAKPTQTAAHHERWLMENESETGFGATVDAMEKDWVRLGKLVGLKPERSQNWVVGVVRRLALLESGQRNVGIEVLSSKPVTVALRATKPRHSGYTVDGVDAVDVVLPVSALYLAARGEDKSGVSLILDSVEYAPGRRFELSARSRSYSISLGRVIEKGDDWLRTSFEVLKKN